MLRKSQSEQSALYGAALSSFGKTAADMVKSQEAWKQALLDQIKIHGPSQVSRALSGIGVKAASRVAEWTASNLDRPQRTADFQLLLKHLGIPEQPTLRIATRLRSKRQQLGRAMRTELEAALSTADLSPLVTGGSLEVPATSHQFRGMIVTRVLAVSPHQEIVQRQQTRVLFDDVEGRGRWLE
jgi:hypothetical protein